MKQRILKQAEINADHGWTYVVFDALSVVRLDDKGCASLGSWVYRGEMAEAVLTEDMECVARRLAAELVDLGYKRSRISAAERNTLKAPALGDANGKRVWYKLSWAE